MTVYALACFLLATPAELPAKKCTPEDIIVQIKQKLGPKEYGAFMIGWNGRPMAPVILRTNAEDRFHSNEKGWISICKEGHRQEKRKMANGFEKKVWVYEEVPPKKKS